METALLNFAHASGIFDFMHSPWGWPLVESLHFLGLSLLIGTVGLFDLRLIGLGRGISYSLLHKLIPFGVAGYCLNVITGSMFLMSAPDQYLYNPAFQTKIALMAIAGSNMLLYYLICNRQVKLADSAASLPGNTRVFASISLFCWCAIIVCGRLITYYRPPYHWCFWC